MKINKPIGLLILIVTLLTGCKDYVEVTKLQFDQYIQDSYSNSIHFWKLIKEDNDFYYVRIETGFMSYDRILINKGFVQITFDKNDLPVTIKSHDMILKE